MTLIFTIYNFLEFFCGMVRELISYVSDWLQFARFLGSSHLYLAGLCHMSKGAQGIEEENFWAELVCRLKVCRRRISRLFHITSNGEDDPTNPGGSSVRLESHIEALASFGYVMRGERHYEETYKG
ncbi:hypothetical protein BofuT4_P145850.1 [Botrytis cinerea T4]|uniref:Uncharacterized protein n=1 Tax=Botryotinia fuckeliana (strain T4) TaxID=999810 RepID=G2YXR8_BOTF4|nr:hypothetical protein BofuT4_P145850.1 [Botrytis cinerea T4]